MYWTPELVAEFMPLLRRVLDANGLYDISPTPGETTNWTRFHQWGYAETLAEDEKAMGVMGLITSHGFFDGKAYGRGYGDHRSTGNDVLRNKKPELHSWVTSTSWAQMDVDFINQVYGNIYSAKVNSIIPWALIQRPSQWVGGDPNPGCAFYVGDKGNLEVHKGYWFYRQVSRIGMPGMHVARAFSTATESPIIAFSGDGTPHSDAFTILNVSKDKITFDIKIEGSRISEFNCFRTSFNENGISLPNVSINNGYITYTLAPRSVTTFVGK